MITVQHPSEAINPGVIKPGSVIYCAGNAATPRELLKQLAADLTITDIDMYSVLLL
ncbi:acetyl-CoA hydrolase, partial [candidate division GN15 bacterium]|nr:acetyl-CoA hydrolase [candidate division GN15 bacterium]